ncbi:uncharacterized protein LOC122386895 [Amphibalanus amphitrite]|uniref:uncharacterized protein LOC122386895 n=1 Tax=Amphibalanus amphitrite TaxID=1232801 RepID=UPI001C91C65B|nr:uncharacterized protein LOC122386895 [Amphibalanus amphitrite]
MSFSGETAAGPETADEKQTTSRQFLYVDDTGQERKLRLKEEVLRAFLESDDVSDKPVAVISVAGAFRTGKSFLLNEMSRYLTAKNKGQWRDVKKGSFTWKNGAKSHTNGMFISPPIKITLDSGQEAILFLLDTQGLFDEDSNMSDATKIFALSTLLSSMQVFNLQGNLKSDDLDHLQLFGEIGRMARDRSNRTAFQNLLFLIRDWDHPDTHPFGKQGGDALVQTRMESGKKDLNQRRQHIETCFAKISGFLMPYPGSTVARGSTFSDDEMGKEFSDALDKLLTLLLSRDKIPLKMNGNRPVTCGELATLIRRYAELFQSGKLPEPKSMLQIVSEACNAAAVDAELGKYVTKMNKLLAEDAPPLTEEIIMKKHSEEKLAAVEGLKNRDTVPDSTKSEEHYCSLLAHKIEEWLETARNNFTARCANDRENARKANENLVKECMETFDASMRNLESDMPVGEEKIREAYYEAGKVAVDRFTRDMISLGSYVPTDCKHNLETSLKERLDQMLARDEDLSNATEVERQFLRYKAQMEDLLADGAPSLDNGMVEGHHGKELRLSLSALQPLISMKHSTNSEDHYSGRLESKILSWFEESQELFHEKCTADKMRADEVNCELVKDCTMSFKHALIAIERDQAANKTKMQEAMEVAERNAWQRFERELIIFGSYDADEGRQQLHENIRTSSQDLLKRQEEMSNSAVVRDLLEKYTGLMELLADGDSLINSELVTRTHSQAKQHVLDVLEGRLSLQHSTKSASEYWRLLHNQIDEWFNKLPKKFEAKCEKQNINVAVNALEDFFKSFEEKLPSVSEKNYLKSRDEEKQIVLRDYSEQAASLGSYSSEGLKNRLDQVLDELADQMICIEKTRRRGTKLKIFTGTCAAVTAVAGGALAVAAAPVAVAALPWFPSALASVLATEGAVGAAIVGGITGLYGTVLGTIGILKSDSPQDVRKKGFVALMQKKEDDKKFDREAIRLILKFKPSFREAAE